MDVKKGWLLKWTNYMKGYRERWFVLEKGVLSYYRTQSAPVAECCGTFVVHEVIIEVETGNNFTVKLPQQFSSQIPKSLHLRAHNESERHEWIAAIECAKSVAAGVRPIEFLPPMLSTMDDSFTTRVMESASEGELSDDDGDLEKASESMLKGKLGKMHKWHEQLSNTCDSLQQQLKVGSEDVAGVGELEDETKLVQASASELVDACSEYLNQVEAHHKQWFALLQSFKSKRIKLESDLERLATEHQQLEFEAGKMSHSAEESLVSSAVASDASESEDEFYDADDGTTTPTVLESNAVVEFSTPKEKPSSQSIAKVANFTRRTRIPLRPENKLSLWTLIKSCVGKDLSKIAMPVNFNEPLSFVQRLCEDLEYSHLLDSAAKCSSPLKRMAYVAAFTASAFASGAGKRTGKPFNPLLGETYELDRRAELGWRVVVEQVSHHPPVTCMHCESNTGWVYSQECSFNIKFRGKYIEVTPTGVAHVHFNDTGDHFTWTKVPTTVHNVIVGELWVDQHGTMVLTNHRTKDTCTMKYVPYSMFAAADAGRKIIGKCMDDRGNERYSIDGSWDKQLSIEEKVTLSRPEVVWIANKQVIGDEMYGMTPYAFTLNELSPVDEGCCPTDARLRPDVRAMEQSDFEHANKIKVSLEEAQRARRRTMEKNHTLWSPRWFELVRDQHSPNMVYQFKGGYWEAKRSQQWGLITDIYNTSPPK
eukprot:m.37813 g.37813  ORF g.37813 m.37813 type:complete len:707 (+) comp17763_c0_seq1:135-2255(+)